MWILGRKGPSGFSASSTAEEVTKGIDGTGLTAVVTGASSGIGTETTRVLALRGVHVVMAVRNTDAGRKVKEAILKENPNAKLDVMELDLGSMASVRKFGSEYKSLGLPLNLLINNAGVMAPFMLTQDNIEQHFGTNHIGHFLLTNLLLETMKSTTRESQKEGRIVNVSSEGHRLFRYPEGVRFDKINDKSSFRTVYAYGQSKLANILHANELAKRFKEEGVEITANSVHPGVIATNLLRHHSIVNGLFTTVVKIFVKSIPQGAATTCYVALHPQVKGVSGEYFSDSNLAKPIALAKDEELAKKLWDFSLSLTDPK
ncbi:short-chain dehydrogenase TIC 32, chloroplastic-like [Rhododendron vialii]|uniref:short-chain dehydrogenase TIC 32, chloroplastic-like n=1 Tax=Rhododendron vialii TaxID=182163 RepID=UPI00265DC909|nr:short-chain dehydrogenase TIC 32, chloroplastic-like [Rhododendron vialii]